MDSRFVTVRTASFNSTVYHFEAAAGNQITAGGFSCFSSVPLIVRPKE
jgi:hypothetical protein